MPSAQAEARSARANEAFSRSGFPIDRGGAVSNWMSMLNFRRLSRLLALASLAVVAACAGTRGGPIEYERADFGVPDAAPVATLEESYKIAPLDTVKVTVFQVPDLSGDYEVDLTGHIALPLIGSVKAVDMTTVELDQKLTRQLGARYLQSPDITVGIKTSSRRVVTVDGSVRDPGNFALTADLTLIQAIAMAKGTSEDANPRRVAIFRQIGGERQAAAFDLVSIRRGEAPDPRIYSGDIIVVDGSKLKAIQRELLTALPLVGIFSRF